jgi:acetyl esterase/lipase
LQFSALLSALASCASPAAFVNALVPTGGFRTVRDVPYGGLPRQKLDIYVPTGAQQQRQPAPVVIFLYGGGWRSGMRADYLFAGEAFAGRGYVTVIPDYRLYPEARFPLFLEDAAAAMAWTKRFIAEHGGDPTRIYLVGHSAGAYNAAMLTLDERWLAAAGLDARRDISAAVAIAGPYDFLPLAGWLKPIFDVDGIDLETTQPIAQVDGGEAPLLLITGLSDETVDPGNSRRLAARIREKGGRVEERYYRNVTHLMVVGALAAPLRFLAPVLDDTVDFLRRN